MNWFRQQAYSMRAAAAQLRQGPANFLLNMLVLAMTLALPFAGLTLLENLTPITAQLNVEAEISVFLKMDTSRETAAAQESAIRKIFQAQGQETKIVFVPREKALEALKDKSGLADAVTTLGANPLPDGFLIRLVQGDSSGAAYHIDSIVDQLQKLPAVDKVQLDSAWVKRLAALMRVINMVLMFLAGTLGIVVIAVAFNTIRLQVMSHLEELALMRLVGATDAFIRRPFYYSGALLGFGAGCIALVVVALALLPLNFAIADLAKLYASDLQIEPLDISSSAGLLAISAFLGWMGAALSVRRNLARID
jgi:cell division transport system permease protein